MENGAERAYRHAKEGAPNLSPALKTSKESGNALPPRLLRSSWKLGRQIGMRSGSTRKEVFGGIPIDEIKKMSAITGRRLQA
eukprot:8319314-Heterocapsa_arctica.AAC.1